MNIVITDIALGAVAVFMFQFRNPHRDFIHSVSAFTFLSLGFSVIYFMGFDWDSFVYKGLALGFSFGLVLSYFLRFKKKKTIGVIDYVKWIGIFFIMMIPASNVSFGSSLFLVIRVLGMLTYPVLMAIYVYDRFILKP